MSASLLFWIGFGLVLIANAGFALAVVRAAALADEDMQRALRQQRAERAHSSPHQPPHGADAPRALFISSPARGATPSRRRGHTT